MSCITAARSFAGWNHRLRGQRIALRFRRLLAAGAGLGDGCHRDNNRLVGEQAESEGLHEVFLQAGFEWRKAGCSMCLAMNPDKLQGREISASSSNRNFKGRQGSPVGRTLLMSPAMVAAAAVTGRITDIREMDLADLGTFTEVS